jgi:lipopolysaccharide export system permease protein
MSLIHRDILKSFFRILIMTLVGALILFTLIDLFDHLDSFEDNNASTLTMARYYVNKVPEIIDTVLPIAMLMATLFTIGGMARYNELTALFATGRSLMQVTRPLQVIAVLTMLFSFAWSEFVMPPANAEVDRIWEVEVHGNANRRAPTNDVSLNGRDQRLYYARTWVPEKESVRGFRAIGAEGAVVKERWDAARANWDGSQWVLEEGYHRIFDERGETLESFDRIESGLSGVTPESFRSTGTKPEEMNVRQLRDYVELIRHSGGDTTIYEVDMQFKMAFPFVHLIVVMLGVMLASGPRKTTVASGFGWTIFISFGYYLAINFGRALGHSGSVPPIAAAWAGNLVFSVCAVVLFLRIRR